MKYMLMMYFEENTALTQEQREHCYLESAAFAQELHKQGKFLGAAPLQPTSTATSLRLENGHRIVTDGPFAETREQLGGFFLIDAKDLDEAIEIASRVPAGRWGTVEIRPVVDVGGLPQT
ncbi:MAG TPA: YciI family protein [Candidatus Eisenbacteria bacterium]|nr:YciI family protein [Candidatus Eisenbacteria bacterium]